MGNFGKRILIVLLSVVAVLAIAIIGNAYQQAERIHKVSDSKATVYSGSYSGVDYTITRADLWETVINSSAMDLVTEMMNIQLLQSVIDQQTDSAAIEKKIEYLTYGTNDADAIADIKADSENDNKYKENFKNKLTVVGYTAEEYAKIQLAYEAYAKYRLEAGLKVGEKEYDLSDEAITKVLEAKYEDTYAIIVKFYGEKDADGYLAGIFDSTNSYVEVSDQIRYYYGYLQYRPEFNDDGTIKLNDAGEIVYAEQEVKNAEGETITVKIPYANVKTEKDSDGNVTYLWDEEFQAFISTNSSTTSTYERRYILQWDETDGQWEYYKVWEEAITKDDAGETTRGDRVYVKDGESFTDYDYLKDTLMKSYDDQTSFTTSNTCPISANEMFQLCLTVYNKYYQYMKEQISDQFDEAAAGFTNEKLIPYGYVLVDGKVRKYAGNDEYVIDFEKSTSTNIVYKTAKAEDGDEIKIPNYEVEKNEDGTYVISSKDEFTFKKDKSGNKIPLEGKLEIDAEGVTYTTSNTLAISDAELFGLYLAINGSEAFPSYAYDDLSSDMQKELYTTLTATQPYTAYAAKVGSDYYLIYRVSPIKKMEATEEAIASYKAEQIETYVADESFVNTCLADLRKEAGLKIYDNFLALDYKNDIVYNSSSNTYGPTSANVTSYYKTKGYQAKKICALTAKKVTIAEGKTISPKCTITADNVLDYALEHGKASYIASAAMTKILLSMPEFSELHGGDVNTNYLTSKNWLMQSYATQTQNMNYYYEYYKQLYAQYGLTYQYNSVKEFLYSYGARSYDALVKNLEKNTMRNVFLYKTLMGQAMNAELTSSYQFSTDIKELISGSEKFTKIAENYIDINVAHVLFYVDLDEDGSPDDYNDFLEALTNGTSTYKLTADEFDAVMNDLYAQFLDYLYDSDTTALSSSSSTALSDFITKFNDSSRDPEAEDDAKKFGEFKNYGIHVKYESLGEVTTSSITSYVQEFQDALRVLQSKLAKTDKDFLGYTISDGLTATSFGEHFIYSTAGDDFEIPSFKFESTDYVAAMNNDSDAISDSQIAAYMLEYFYSSIYGNSDDPASRAGFDYPNLPTEITEKIEAVYGDFLTLIMDKSNVYNTSYIILKDLASKGGDLATAFGELADVYYAAIYED